ncbi:hypothetical protein BHE74_00054142 [Ensete ventricosum]|nr:hypothetical protein BHE74_00054142 [Ensete ventricosum]
MGAASYAAKSPGCMGNPSGYGFLAAIANLCCNLSSKGLATIFVQSNHRDHSLWLCWHPAAVDHLCRQRKDYNEGISHCLTPEATVTAFATATTSLFPFSRSEHRCLHDAASLYRNNLSLPSLSQRCSFPVVVAFFLSYEDNPTTTASSAIAFAPAISHICPPTVGPIHNFSCPTTIAAAASTTVAPSSLPLQRIALLPQHQPPTITAPCYPAASFSTAIFLSYFFPASTSYLSPVAATEMPMSTSLAVRLTHATFHRYRKKLNYDIG